MFTAVFAGGRWRNIAHHLAVLPRWWNQCSGHWVEREPEYMQGRELVTRALQQHKLQGEQGRKTSSRHEKKTTFLQPYPSSI